MNGFTKNRIGRDIEYILQSNPRVTVIRSCYCSYNCMETWMTKVDDEVIDGGYNSYFRDAVKDAFVAGEKLAVNPNYYRY